MAPRQRKGRGVSVTWPQDADVARGARPTCPSPRPVRPPPPAAHDSKMAAPSRNGAGGGAASFAALLLAAVALGLTEAVSEPTTVAFDVRPGGVVHSFSQDVGPGVGAAVARGI